ncbi:MAG: hypothetical protein Q7T96_12370, partial [Methylobacter sp.]|nr:hypothetical protein [Methylobacter sp.]
TLKYRSLLLSTWKVTKVTIHGTGFRHPCRNDEFGKFVGIPQGQIKLIIPDPIDSTAYLGEVTTNSMRLSANVQHDLDVAEILISWKDAVNEKFA